MRIFFIALIVAASVASVRAEDQQKLPVPSGFNSLSFGVAKLPEPPPEVRMTHHGPREVPSRLHAPHPPRPHRPEHRSGIESVFTRGLSLWTTRPPRVSEQPIDCTMAKPADPHLDHRMVREPTKKVHHSGIVRVVPPCK